MQALSRPMDLVALLSPGVHFLSVPGDLNLALFLVYFYLQE